MRRPWSVEWSQEHRRRFLFRFGTAAQGAPQERPQERPAQENLETGESAVWILVIKIRLKFGCYFCRAIWNESRKKAGYF